MHPLQISVRKRLAGLFVSNEETSEQVSAGPTSGPTSMSPAFSSLVVRARTGPRLSSLFRPFSARINAACCFDLAREFPRRL